jgi:hypothetical protein
MGGGALGMISLLLQYERRFFFVSSSSIATIFIGHLI